MNNRNVLGMNEIREAGVCVVALTGRIDSTNSDDLTKRLMSLITAGEKSIVVDLAEVRYLTSSAFRALLIAAREAERKAARFALCSMASHVRELFDMGGLLVMFTVHGSRQEAFAGSSGGAVSP